MRSQYGPLHFVDEETGAGTLGSLAKVTELEGGQSCGIRTPALKLSTTTLSSRTEIVQILHASLPQWVAWDK